MLHRTNERRRERGASLVEMTVAIGVLGIVAYFLVTFFSGTKAGQQASDSRQAASEETTEMFRLLSKAMSRREVNNAAAVTFIAGTGRSSGVTILAASGGFTRFQNECEPAPANLQAVAWGSAIRGCMPGAAPACAVGTRPIVRVTSTAAGMQPQMIFPHLRDTGGQKHMPVGASLCFRQTAGTSPKLLADAELVIVSSDLRPSAFSKQQSLPLRVSPGLRVTR